MAEAQWQLYVDADTGTSQPVLKLVGVLALVCSLAFAGLATDSPQYLHMPLIYLAAVSTLFIFGLHVLCKSIVSGGFNFVGLDIFFIAGFVLYNQMLTIMAMTGQIPFDALGTMPSPQYATKAALLSAACGNAFIAGFALKGGPLYKGFCAPLPLGSVAAALWVGRMGFVMVILGLLSRLSYIFLFAGASSYFGQRMVETTIHGSAGGRLFFVATILIRLGVAAIAVGYAISRGKLAPKAFWLVLSAIVLLHLIEGERGTIFVCVLSLLIARHLFIKRVRLVFLVIVGISLLVVFGAVRVARQMPERSLAAVWQVLTERREDVNIQTTFMETSGSFTTIPRTMARVPSLEGYKYGMTIVPGLTSTVPGLSGLAFWLLGRTSADAALYASPAAWLTWRESGGVPTSGLGFSSVAEGYLNWGVVGAPLMFLVVGLLLRTLESRAYRAPTLLRVMLFVVACDQVFYWARSSLDGWCRPMAWVAVIVWIAYCISGARQIPSDDESYNEALYMQQSPR